MSFLRVFINLFQFNRTNWKAVLLCLIAASVFWVFNALNKEYISTIRFPLHFEYNEELASPLEPLPAHLLVNVSGNGWQLFSPTVGYKLPVLIIPLEKPLEVKKIVGSTLPPMLANQLGKLQINFIATDTIYLQLDQKDTHTYKLFADAKDVSFKEGYGRISPIVILPDSVQLSGPKSLLHTLPDSLVVTLTGNRLTANYREQLPISISGSDMIKRNPPVAEVMFEVSEVTIMKVRSKVETRNVSRGKELSLDVDSVNITIQVPKTKQEDFKNVKPSSVIDLKKIKKGEYLLRPIAHGVPSYATVLKVDSVMVKIK